MPAQADEFASALVVEFIASALADWYVSPAAAQVAEPAPVVERIASEPAVSYSSPAQAAYATLGIVTAPDNGVYVWGSFVDVSALWRLRFRESECCPVADVRQRNQGCPFSVVGGSWSSGMLV